MTNDFLALLIIVFLAAACPLVAHAIPRRVVPEAVLLLIAGAVIGPNALGIVQETEIIRFLAQLGLAFQFLLAGYEIDPKLLSGKKGRKGLYTWLVTFALALFVTFVFIGDNNEVNDNRIALLSLAIAMTSTAFGTVVSILKERKLEGTPIGDSTLSYGVWGQLGPVVAIALLLTSRAAWKTVVALIGLIALCLIVGKLAKWVSQGDTKVMRAIYARRASSSQMNFRLTLLLLVGFIALASLLGLNIMLGAFAAGFIMSYVLPEGHRKIETKLSGIGYGFFIPLFFVASGMKIDLAAVASHPLMLVICLIALIVVRMGPVFVAQSVGTWHRVARIRDRAAVAAYCTTALSIIVAVTTIAVDAGALGQQSASIMVAAAAVSVLAMPLLAQLLHGNAEREAKSVSSTPCS